MKSYTVICRECGRVVLFLREFLRRLRLRGGSYFWFYWILEVCRVFEGLVINLSLVESWSLFFVCR